jgi:hypothetical protein
MVHIKSFFFLTSTALTVDPTGMIVAAGPTAASIVRAHSKRSELCALFAITQRSQAIRAFATRLLWSIKEL